MDTDTAIPWPRGAKIMTTNVHKTSERERKKSTNKCFQTNVAVRIFFQTIFFISLETRTTDLSCQITQLENLFR